MLETTPTPATEEGADVSRPWGLPQGLGAILLSYAVAVVGGAILVTFFRTFYTHHPLASEIVAYQFLALGVAISAVAFIFMPFQVGPAKLCFTYPGSRNLALAALAVIPIIIGVAAIAGLFDALFPWYHLHGNAKESIPVSHRGATRVKEVLTIVWAGIEVPLVEETLFRGILYQGLRHAFARRLPKHGAIFAAAAVSGLIFGLLHFEPHTAPILVFVGFSLAYVFQYGRSIYCSMIVHGAINTLAVIQLFGSA